jgi:hypothetical protein
MKVMLLLVQLDVLVEIVVAAVPLVPEGLKLCKDSAPLVIAFGLPRS